MPCCTIAKLELELVAGMVGGQIYLGKVTETKWLPIFCQFGTNDQSIIQ